MNGSQQGASLLLSFVLAALLGPAEFGMLAMALVFVEFVYQLLEQGIGPTLVQRRDLQTRHLNTVFWAMAGAALVLAAGVVGLSNWWAQVNRVPKLAGVICGLAAVIPINSLAIVPQALLQRALNFRALAIRSIAAVCVGGVVAVLMAWWGFGVWALVGQQLVTSVVGTATVWLASRWYPRVEFSLMSLWELLRFSFAVFLGNLGTFVGSRIDALIIGLFFGPVAVGLYRFAHRLVSSAVELTMRPFHVVSLPHLARHQDDGMQRHDVLTKCLQASTALCMPAMAALAAMATPLITLLGSRWLPAVNVLRVLCLLGLVKSATIYVAPALLAAGRPYLFNLYCWLLAAGNVGALVVIGLLLRERNAATQTLGLAIAQVIGFSLVSLPAVLYVLRRWGRISPREVLTVAGRACGLSILLFVAGLAVCSTVASSFGASLCSTLLTIGLIALAGAGCVLLLSADIRHRLAQAFLNLASVVWPRERKLGFDARAIGNTTRSKPEP
jgi:PST family polysaccharide transporter